jgi:hypothetical protein
MGNYEGKRRLGKCKHMLEDHVKMDLKEIWSEKVDSIRLA